ncbi:MAG: M10 family metallopeptidase C-terminal domain-containing protein, partial [Paracoccaceae bacterium]
GGDGDDSLTGGDNADTFWFFDTDQMGRDRIIDFEDGLDRLNLSDFGFSTAADVVALAQSAGGLSQHTRINLSPGSNGEMRWIQIENLDLADFDVSDVQLFGENPFFF